VEVTGTVTRQGKPVPNVIVNFMPQGGRPSWGQADANGRFKMNYDAEHPGALVGTHTVWITLPPRSPQDEVDFAAGKLKQAPDLQAILAKYGDQKTTQLKIEIKSDTREIELKLD